jgi:hypothetical protein
VNAVCGDDDISRGGPAVRERYPSTAVVLFKTAAAMSGTNDLGRQCIGKDLDQIGPMHSERGVPAGRIRDLDRGDRRAIVTEVPRAVPYPGAPFFDGRSQPDSFQVAHAVGGEKHSGTDFAEGGGLFIHRHRHAARNQRVGSEQPANASSNNDGGGPVAHDHFPGKTAAKYAGSHFLYLHTD